MDGLLFLRQLASGPFTFKKNKGVGIMIDRKQLLRGWLMPCLCALMFALGIIFEKKLNERWLTSIFLRQLPYMVTTVAGVYDIVFSMRRCRIKLPNRCYHLISRVAHRAFFLDDEVYQ